MGKSKSSDIPFIPFSIKFNLKNFRSSAKALLDRYCVLASAFFSEIVFYPNLKLKVPQFGRAAVVGCDEDFIDGLTDLVIEHLEKS